MTEFSPITHSSTTDHCSLVLLSGMSCALGTDLLDEKKLNGHTLIRVKDIDPLTAFCIGSLAATSAIATVRVVPTVYKYLCEHKPNQKWAALGLIPVTLIPFLATQSVPAGLTLASLTMMAITVQRTIRPHFKFFIACVIKEAHAVPLEDLETNCA